MYLIYFIKYTCDLNSMMFACFDLFFVACSNQTCIVLSIASGLLPYLCALIHRHLTLLMQFTQLKKTPPLGLNTILIFFFFLALSLIVLSLLTLCFHPLVFHSLTLRVMNKSPSAESSNSLFCLHRGGYLEKNIDQAMSTG